MSSCRIWRIIRTFLRIIIARAKGSKYARMSAIVQYYEEGNVFRPGPGIHPWAGDLEAEPVTFDDQFEALSMAMAWHRAWSRRGVSHLSHLLD